MARSDEIAEALAAYLYARRTQLAVLPASVEAAPVTYHATETDAGPRIFVYPIEITNSHDTREDWRTDYQIGVTCCALLVSGDTVTLKTLKDLSESVREVIKNETMSGAEFLSLGSETAVPEFDIQQEMVGQYFISTVTAEYLEVT